MANYGITSESQLLDYKAIENGCNAYIEAAAEFITAAQQIIEAGDICDKKALAADGQSMQPVIYELGQSVAAIGNECAQRAIDLYNEAINVYNAQVAELNAYYQRLAAEQAAREAAQNNGSN